MADGGVVSAGNVGTGLVAGKGSGADAGDDARGGAGIGAGSGMGAGAGDTGCVQPSNNIKANPDTSNHLHFTLVASLRWT